MQERKIKSIALGEAVENFSSAEQLDQRLVLVRGRSWLLLAIGVLAIVFAILWGFLGRVPHRISGEGLLIEKNLPVIVSSPAGSGGVVKLMGPLGGMVKEGQQILVISNPQFDKEVATAESYHETLKAQDALMRADEAKLIAKHQASVDAQVKVANDTLAQTTKLVTMYEAEVSDLEALAKKQLIPQTQLVQGRAALFSAMQQVSTQTSLIAQAQVGLESILSTVSQSQSTRFQTLTQAADTLAKLRIKQEQATSVVAPLTGRIIDHKVNLGSVLAPGGDVLTLLPMEDMSHDLQRYHALAYLPYGQGKEVRIGMRVVISLPYAKPSRYGYIKGTVNGIRDYAVGSNLGVHLGSDSLAAAIKSKVGTPLEISVRVELDASTPSGLAWTSVTGYPEVIPMLSLCTVQVTVKEDRPIDLVLPWIKDKLGIDQAPSLTPAVVASPG